MRRALDALYDGAAALAALFMVLLLVMVLLSIARPPAALPHAGTDAYAGYMMAGGRLPGAGAHAQARRAHPRHAAAAGAARRRAALRSSSGRWPRPSLLAALVAFYSVRLAWQSHAVQRHLDRQRRHAAVAAAAGDGDRHAGAGDRLRRRAGARTARQARPRGQRRSGCTTNDACMNDVAITALADRRAVRDPRQRRLDRPHAVGRGLDRHAAVQRRGRPATRWR